MWVWRVVEDLRDGVVVEGHGEIVLPEPIKRPHSHGPVGRVRKLKKGGNQQHEFSSVA